ncbi:hypothetical protein POJ06DRAFT_264038 [Lipomyces tetrasporus]|uniref:Uncharacterized protein n=1 Tax=Lipomyces tetrasporus TaxID=54092 RepID=A0AAD7QKF9_9ASCO|nr:uncharacterized protein POJ06DRAFT_264038 [Lipomyces tetrasporus]KAJ8096525.1 hypothetical protein POJ06DRAFT_264038 [Lipomyces tetrasporus]
MLIFLHKIIMDPYSTRQTHQTTTGPRLSLSTSDNSRSPSPSPIQSRSPSPASTATSSHISFSDTASPFFATSAVEKPSDSTMTNNSEASSKKDMVGKAVNVKTGEQQNQESGSTERKGFVLCGPGGSKMAEELQSARPFSPSTILRGPSYSYAGRY